MKKINILACFLAFQISYPAPSGIFSVTATEEISDALLENINSELKQLSNTKNFAVDSHAELSISKENCSIWGTGHSVYRNVRTF